GWGGGGCPLPFAAGRCAPCGALGPGAGAACFPGIPGAMPCGSPAGFIAGMTAPQYGMPTSGTPIGLPGPPHVPLGVPAGLQRHEIVNDTHMHIPPPTENFKIKVAEVPGLSYPKPVSRVNITEYSTVPPVEFNQPCDVKHQVVPGAGGGLGCQ